MMHTLLGHAVSFVVGIVFGFVIGFVIAAEMFGLDVTQEEDTQE